MHEAFADGSYERRLIGWGFAYGRHSAALDVLQLMPNTNDDKLIEILLNEVENPEVEGHEAFEKACEMLLDFKRPTDDQESPLDLAKRLIDEYESHPEYDGAGPLHIVLEDPNYELHHVEWCKEQAVKEGNGKAIEVCNALIALGSDRERADATGWSDVYGYEDEGEDPFKVEIYKP